MSHPTTRAERRNHRERVIRVRRFIYEHIWYNFRSSHTQLLREIKNPLIDINYLLEKVEDDEYLHDFYDWQVAWGKYSKWNLNCSCHRCRASKAYNREPRKIRQSLKNAGKDWWKDEGSE